MIVVNNLIVDDHESSLPMMVLIGRLGQIGQVKLQALLVDIAGEGEKVRRGLHVS